MTWDAVEFLKGRHTKQLLNIRDSIYRVNGGLHQKYWDRPSDDDRIGYDVTDGSGCYVTMAQVKAELATREHVPNKAEAKVIRQEKAKAQRNR